MYSCVARVDPDSLDCSSTLLSEHLPRDVVQDEMQAQPDFFTLPFIATDLPKLRARFRKLCVDQSGGFILLADIRALLHDAMRKDQTFAVWPDQKEHRKPYSSLPLALDGHETSESLYPTRIDLYRHSTNATTCNGWRLGRVGILAIIAQTAGFLASKSVCQTEAENLWSLKEQAEKTIQELLDDLCASIPFIINPKHTEEELPYYPHAPGDANFGHVPEPDLVASMSQLLPSLIVGSQIYCIPRSQKQWLQQYMTMLSRNPKEDGEKAMTLSLTDDFISHGYGLSYFLYPEPDF